ncbi:MAG: hypothetical protein Roseis2KO_51940 [Roseivirga sp.]
MNHLGLQEMGLKQIEHHSNKSQKVFELLFIPFSHIRVWRQGKIWFEQSRLNTNFETKSKAGSLWQAVSTSPQI